MIKCLRILVSSLVLGAACLWFTACNSTASKVQYINPRVLGSNDLAFWAWQPNNTSGSIQRAKVTPPEDLVKNFTLSGYAGDFDSVKYDEEWTAQCNSEPTCTKITYSVEHAERGWAGNLWVDVMYPQYSTGVDLTAATKLIFWAKGETGGEKIEFRVGSTQGPDPQPMISTGVIQLQNSWQQYEIDLTGQRNLGHVFSGFGWITTKALNPSGCTFYLDDMQFK